LNTNTIQPPKHKLFVLVSVKPNHNTSPTRFPTLYVVIRENRPYKPVMCGYTHSDRQYPTQTRRYPTQTRPQSFPLLTN
jgi:hypothetical protein